jgi:hypothetical protein
MDGISFVKTITNRYVTVLDDKSVARYICFLRVKDASRCVDYISEFRSKHGYYPELDFRADAPRRIRAVTGLKERSPENIKRFLQIEYHKEELIEEEACSIHKVPLFVCHTFDYQITPEKFQVFLSAQALDCKKRNPFETIQMLNRLYEK